MSESDAVDATCTEGDSPGILHLTLFGPMRGTDSAGRNVLPKSRKAKAILAILALADTDSTSRARLAGMLWSLKSAHQAGASLRQAIHELQACLAQHALDGLRVDRDRLALSRRLVAVDVHAFRAQSPECPEKLALFRPDLLEDLAGIDPAFDGWLADHRRRLMEQARSLAWAIVMQQSTAPARLDAAEKLLRIDPLHDQAWQALIGSHIQLNDRAAALRAYEQCRETLKQASLTPSSTLVALLDDLQVPDLPSAVGKSKAMIRPPYRRSAKIRLAVLPLRIFGGSGDDVVAAGLAEEIIAALARFRELSCIGSHLWASRDRLSALPARAWQDLDLDLVLDGSLQRSGTCARVICRLLDMRAGGTVIWSRQFKRDVCDRLVLQEGLASDIAAQIEPEILLYEAERAASSDSHGLTAHDLVLRAVPTIARLDPVDFHAAGDALARAVAADANYAAAYTWWAHWHIFLVGQGWAKNPATAIAHAAELTERAICLDHKDARALTILGHVKSFLYRRADQAEALHERSLELNPHLAHGWCYAGLTQAYLGRQDQAIELITTAQRLSPNDPHGFFFNAALAVPHFLRGDFETVLDVAGQAISLNPSCSSTYKAYLAALGHLGQDDAAGAIRDKLLALEPNFTIRDAIERSPFVRWEDKALYAEGLRRAGLRQG